MPTNDTCPHHDQLAADVQQIRESQRRIEAALLGYLDGSRVGLVARVSDLERAEQTRARIVWAAVVAAVGAVVVAVLQFLGLGGPR